MDSLLIANRGEIAVRIIRAAKEMGLRTIAVYSELDRDSRHVAMADEAWNIGPAPAADSYLNIDAIIAVARDSNADTVHPGYGFLAENAAFARAVIDTGLIWVGPPPGAISVMGDKISSRRAAQEAGVSGVPGTLEPLIHASDVKAVAETYGYPLAIKAAHGGGGKGLKIVRSPDELEDAYESARREADAYFGHPDVYVERYLDKPRHIEAQVFFDTHGNGVFLGERDCTLQRRHQKLIEESPAAAMPDDTRAALGQAALAVAGQAGYVNAGTVEFLLDQSGDFYFLEMNTRIQVEHTVTEMVTGIDLVQEQLRVAAGQELSVKQTPEPNGHAIEFRINAEDAAKGFLPSPGKIVDYIEPAGFGIRVDSGVVPGSAISQYYDNLIAKLVVWGRDRDEAIARSKRALREFTVSGVATTIPAHLVMLEHPSFLDASHHTRTVETEIDLSGIQPPETPATPEDEELTQRDMTVEVGGRRYVVKVWAPSMAMSPSGAERVAPRRRPPKLERSQSSGDNGGIVAAPMQGTIVKVYKKAGETVAVDEPLCVLEAMKMENEIRSPVAGDIVDLRVSPGDTVSSGAVLMVVK